MSMVTQPRSMGRPAAHSVYWGRTGGGLQSRKRTSTLIGRGPMIFCCDWVDLDFGVTMPDLLCHKEPAQGTPNPNSKSMPCLALCLYGIRVASMHRKDVIGTLMP